MKQKNVAIFFIGSKEFGGLKDAKKWLDRYPEITAMAKVVPFFVPTLPNISSPDFWESLAGKIYKEWDKFDGSVVFHPSESVIYSAAAVSFQIAPLNKPIVFTGAFMAPSAGKKSEKARELEEMSPRANIINAVQVATMDVAEVILLSGNRLIRAVRAERATNPYLTED